MKLKPKAPSKTPDVSGLSAAELLSAVEGLQQELAAKSAEIQQRDHYIQILEELLRWKRIQQFGASSEKSAHQIHLFDEAELEVEIDALRDQLPDDVKEEEAPPASRKRRQRGFSETLLRERIELTLSDEEKVGASATCYSLVETPKANKLEPSVYIQHVLERFADADSLEKLEALLPWNVKLERASKIVSQIN